MHIRSLLILLSLSLAPAPARAQEHADATPTAWHQLARAESLLTAPEPPHPVTVCVVDSGVNLTPDLAPVVVERLAYDGGDPGDTYPQEGIDDGHGTYVATFLAGQVNGWGGAGTWPRAKIVSVRVFPPGGVRTTAGDYLEGMRICRQHPDVKVINLSLGDVDGSPAEISAIADRIDEYRYQDDINVVAAAGNRGGSVEFPARVQAALSVGATLHGDLCEISARGPGLDLLAPGCDLAGASASGQPARFSGTSFAAPLVSAAVAALRSYAGLSAAEAERTLVETAASSEAGPALDVERALRTVGIETPESSAAAVNEQRLVETAPQNAAAPDFVDLQPPRVRLRRRRNRVIFLVRNRPAGASVEVAIGSREYDRRASRWTISVGRGPKSMRLRFLADRGASAWKRFRLPRR